MSDSLQPHGLQHTKPPCPSTTPGESKVAQSYPILCHPVDCSLQCSSVHGIFQARVPEWVAISFSRVSSQPRDRTWVSRIVGRCFTIWTTREDNNSWSLPKLVSIESVMPSNRLILCCPLLLLPSVFPSIRVFSNESVPHNGWPKYWSFSFNISPSNEHSGLISFRMDWLDSLLSKELSRVFSNTTVQKHQFFSAQLSSQANSHIHTWLLEKP